MNTASKKVRVPDLALMKERGERIVMLTEVAERLELDGMHYGADTSGCPIKCIPDLIRKRAYQLFEDRGRRQGHELDDWLQAEREIKHHLGSPDGDK